MKPWLEYTLGRDGVNLVVTVKWFMSSNTTNELEPFLPDVFHVSLTDPLVTPEYVVQQVRAREEQIVRGIATYQHINDVFGAGQGMRIQL